MVLGYPGLEPGTNRLKAEYSTIELATHFSFYFNVNKQIRQSQLTSLLGVSSETPQAQVCLCGVFP
jgi:hypothetical protein